MGCTVQSVSWTEVFWHTCLSWGCALSALEDREGCKLLSSELQRDASGERRWQRSLDRPRSLSPCCQCSDRETRGKTEKRHWLKRVTTLFCSSKYNAVQLSSRVSLTNQETCTRTHIYCHCQPQEVQPDSVEKLHASCMHTNRCDKNRWAGLTSSLIAFVTGSINSLRTFLLLPKTINPLIRNGGDWTLHGATRNLRLFFLMWKHQQAKIDRHESTTYIHKENIKDTVITFRLFNSEISGPLQRV